MPVRCQPALRLEDVRQHLQLALEGRGQREAPLEHEPLPGEEDVLQCEGDGGVHGAGPILGVIC